MKLIVDRLGRLINVTREGQTERAGVLRQHLKRIERNAAGIPVRLFPFTLTDERSGQPASVVIDPHVAFGRPVLAGRAVPTAVLADRFKARDSFEQLAADYRTSAQAIVEALRCAQGLRVSRLLVPEPHSRAVRRRVGKEAAGLDQAAEREAMRCLESVSDFDAR